MSTTDRYRQKLAHAQWTWREKKVCRHHGPSRSKDRAAGRNDKRAARQQDRAETGVRASGDQDLRADEQKRSGASTRLCGETGITPAF